MPKKSRRDRKRVQPRNTVATSLDDVGTPTTDQQMPLMEFTDFSQPVDTNSTVVDDVDQREVERRNAQAGIANDSVENIIAREDVARRNQQVQGGFPVAAAGVPNLTGLSGTPQGATEPEIARALKRVQRKEPSLPPRRPERSIASAQQSTPLPADSAAIPMAQVPYVPSDLRRVAFSALVIVIFIIAGGLLVTTILH